LKVSIITPSYRRQNLLKKNYFSVKKNYKNKNLEWIILTELGDDLTNGLVKTFDARFVKHILGVFRNNDLAIIAAIKKHATGDLLLICGDDDFLYEDTLKILKNNYRPSIKWYIGYGSYLNKNLKKSRRFLTLIKKFLIKNYNPNILLVINFIMAPSSFFSKKIIDKNFFHRKIKYANDYYLWLGIIKKHRPRIIEKFLSKAKFDNSTKTGSFDVSRYFVMLKYMNESTNNTVVKLLQLLAIMAIISVNFFKKKIFKIY
jgi:hypothetical protein